MDLGPLLHKSKIELVPFTSLLADTMAKGRSMFSV